MNIEYEATFFPIDKEDIRKKLRSLNAQLIKSEFLQKRVVFDLPKDHEIKGGWLRIRDEGEKTTLSLKVVDGNKIENQKEICLTINDQRQGEQLLLALGCKKKAYQESKREIWKLGSAELCIDEWPFLDPFLEIEGPSEDDIKAAAHLLNLDYGQALFCSVDQLYFKKYDVKKDIINHHTPEITFDMKNPFVKK